MTRVGKKASLGDLSGFGFISDQQRRGSVGFHRALVKNNVLTIGFDGGLIWCL